MSGLAALGWIALAFGAGSYYAIGAAGWFSAANLAIGALALGLAALRGLAAARGAAAPAFRGTLARGVLLVLAVAAGGVALERLAAATRWQLDWSFERRFEPSPTPARRPRRARLGRGDALSRPLRPARAQHAAAAAHARRGRRAAASASVRSKESARGRRRLRHRVLEQRRAARRRPTPRRSSARPRARSTRRSTGCAGTTPACSTWRAAPARATSRGTTTPATRGSPRRSQTEGYRLREFVTATGAEMPEDAEGLLVLAPRRAAAARGPRRPRALPRARRPPRRLPRARRRRAASRALLARWGLDSPDALVVDPASGVRRRRGAGREPDRLRLRRPPARRAASIAARMTFFRGARAFRRAQARARRPACAGVVFASGRSWLAPDVGRRRARAPPERPADAAEDYHPLVAAGRYPRGGRETRIVAFGDADLASNQYLRALYNLDLVLNAVHWALDREPDITIRPKAGVSGRLQLPLPLQDTFTMFQGVGLLLPELCCSPAASPGPRTERLRREPLRPRARCGLLPRRFGFFVARAKPSAPASCAWSSTKTACSSTTLRSPRRITVLSSVACERLLEVGAQLLELHRPRRSPARARPR